MAIVKANGFTSDIVGWKAWLDIVHPETATEEQINVLNESNSKAKTSEYYLTLVHQPEILRKRSDVFNAIMYAPGGLSRAERELGATVTSRINGCVYCASVHAVRFEQNAKRNDVILEVFQNPKTAGTNDREKAVVEFSAALTESPESITSEQIKKLKAVGLSHLEIFDLINSVAIFAWANRLMLNLGEPIIPD